MKILGVESSCDESALAIFDTQSGVSESLIHSQIDLHALYGGVVPDLASSQHLSKLPVLVKKLSQSANLDSLDLIAATAGPGLPNCLAMGVSCASALAMALGKPLVGVNHLRGHAYSPFIAIHAQDPDNFDKNLKAYLPHLGLTVSGGNTVLFEIDTNKHIRIFAQTMDDAAGEALDKGAKLMGMPYPGAPLIEKLAAGIEPDKNMFPTGHQRPVESEPDFSFSGLKTSLRYKLEKMDSAAIKANMPLICASYQYAVVEQLRHRADFFAKKGNYASIGVSGGVSNNSQLAIAFALIAKKRGAKFVIADKSMRGDNAAMIAFAAYFAPEATLKTQTESPLAIHTSWNLMSPLE